MDDEYDFPPIDLMEAGEPVEKNASGYDAEDMKRAETLIRTLQSFSIPVKLTGVSHGPAVTRFEFLPAPGIKVSRILILGKTLGKELKQALHPQVVAPARN